MKDIKHYNWNKRDNVGVKGSQRRVHPVTIEGVDYPSISVAADTIGIPRTTLIYRLNNNIPIHDTDERGVPVTWNGVDYASVSDMAKAEGYSYWQAYRMTRTNGWVSDEDIVLDKQARKGSYERRT